MSVRVRVPYPDGPVTVRSGGAEPVSFTVSGGVVSCPDADAAAALAALTGGAIDTAPSPSEKEK